MFFAVKLPKKQLRKIQIFYIKFLNFMWYFAWVLGTALAVCFGIINALWHEMRDDFKEENE